MTTRVGFAAIVALVAVLVWLVVKPSPIDAVAYSPPEPPPLTGVLAPNNRLLSSELLALGKIDGPEEVALDADGGIYAGTADGKILYLSPDKQLHTFADTGGRPLGLQFDANQNLIVCDAHKGLLSINPQGEISVLATTVDELRFAFTDALDVASDGMIYFTDASSRYTQKDYLYDLLEARPHGRFMRYNPLTGQVEVLLSQLYFANGVALSQKEDFVLINETYRYRIVRYWLKGTRAGTHDVFIDNLPGFPDNISSNGNGVFWLSLFTIRNPLMDRMHPHPFLKSLVSKLPKAFWPKPKPYGLVLALDEHGNITQSLHEPTGEHLREITSTREDSGYLYLGSLGNDRIGKYRLTR